MTPVRSSQDTRIDAPVEDVWAVLGRFGAISSWADRVDHSRCTTEATSGVGAARRVQLGRVALIETVTVWDPPQALAYTIEGLPPVVASVTNRWDVHADGAGSRATLTTVIDPGPRPVGRIAARVLGLVMKRPNAGLLRGLATAAAGGGTRP